MADTEVTESIESEFNLVMLGNPESTDQEALPHTPLEFTDNGLRLKGKEYVVKLQLQSRTLILNSQNGCLHFLQAPPLKWRN